MRIQAAMDIIIEIKLKKDSLNTLDILYVSSHI